MHPIDDGRVEQGIYFVLRSDMYLSMYTYLSTLLVYSGLA